MYSTHTGGLIGRRERVHGRVLQPHTSMLQVARSMIWRGWGRGVEEGVCH